MMITNKIRAPLKNVMEMISSTQSDQIPIFPSYLVFVSLVQTYIVKWKEHIEALFNGYKNILTNYLKEVISTRVNCLPSIESFLNIRVIETVLNDHISRTEKELDKAFKVEMRPYTLNNDLFANIKKRRSAQMIDEIKKEDKVDNIISILIEYGIDSSLSNEEQEAMELITAVQAYLSVARKRFTDRIPVVIYEYLLQPFCDGSFKSALQLSDEELAGCLAENSQVKRRRKDLESKLHILESCSKAIMKELIGF